jgi:hypothetical protein
MTLDSGAARLAAAALLEAEDLDRQTAQAQALDLDALLAMAGAAQRRHLAAKLTVSLEPSFRVGDA